MALLFSAMTIVRCHPEFVEEWRSWHQEICSEDARLRTLDEYGAAKDAGDRVTGGNCQSATRSTLLRLGPSPAIGVARTSRALAFLHETATGGTPGVLRHICPPTIGTVLPEPATE